jgi:hypothetical protein
MRANSGRRSGIDQTSATVRDRETHPAPDATAPERGCIQVGLVATPALNLETVTRLANEVAALLSERYPDVCWEVPSVRDALVSPPTELTELVDAARDRLLDEDWDLVVSITDLPLRLARRPLLTHTSPTHGVALVSLPALGVRNVTARLLNAIGDAVSILVGDAAPDNGGQHVFGRKAGVQRRLVELATDLDDRPGSQGVAFLPRLITGNIRLLLGMIRANRPWRLVGRLSRALLGALAAGAYAVVDSDGWRIASSLDAVRLLLLMLGTIALAGVTMIAAHGLWERAGHRRVREQVALFNLVTAITVTFGIAALYATVFIVSLGVAGLMIDAQLFTTAVRHPVDVSDYLKLAWLASSLATVGGALGGVLESDETVREAAYAYQPDTREAARNDRRSDDDDDGDQSRAHSARAGRGRP